MSTPLPSVSGSVGSSPTPGSHGGPPPPPQRPRSSSLRLISTLALAGAVAGFFIVLVHQWSEPQILEHQARVLREAVGEVLGGPETTRTFFLLDDAFTDMPAPDADTAGADRVYVGFDGNGSPLGVAIAAGEPGFQDIIRLIFGYDPGSGMVLGMKVLESKETPGLGDKIEKDSTFVGAFRGLQSPLLGVKVGAGSGAPGEVVMITGATISSRAVIDIINHRLSAVGDRVHGLWRSGLAASTDGGTP